jgi:hypothetical protein
MFVPSLFWQRSRVKFRRFLCPYTVDYKQLVLADPSHLCPLLLWLTISQPEHSVRPACGASNVGSTSGGFSVRPDRSCCRISPAEGRYPRNSIRRDKHTDHSSGCHHQDCFSEKHFIGGSISADTLCANMQGPGTHHVSGVHKSVE